MADGETVTISSQEARALCAGVLESRGAPSEHAAAQADVLVEADLRGRPSHGMQRLPTLVARIERGLLDPSAEPSIQWRTSSFLAVDGRHGLGPLVARRAIAELRRATATAGVAMAAIANSSHVGMLAPYLEEICSYGLLGLMLTTSEALVHPAGGRTALLGTNPIGVGLPAQPDPFVLDMSTAAISAGEVIAHAHRGAPLPPGSAVDAQGVPTLDPGAAIAGALSPFGGAKGYGLALAIELLVALVTGTALGRAVRGTLDVDHRATKGDVVLVIDPRSVDLEQPDRYFAGYLEELRAAPTADGVESVLIPGDRMRTERRYRRANGIVFPAHLWAQLRELQAGSGSRE